LEEEICTTVLYDNVITLHRHYAAACKVQYSQFKVNSLFGAVLATVVLNNIP